MVAASAGVAGLAEPGRVPRVGPRPESSSGNSSDRASARARLQMSAPPTRRARPCARNVARPDSRLPAGRASPIRRQAARLQSS